MCLRGNFSKKIELHRSALRNTLILQMSRRSTVLFLADDSWKRNNFLSRTYTTLAEPILLNLLHCTLYCTLDQYGTAHTSSVKRRRNEFSTVVYHFLIQPLESLISRPSKLSVFYIFVTVVRRVPSELEIRAWLFIHSGQ